MENKYEFMTLNDISDAQVTIHLNTGWVLHSINVISLGIHGYVKEFYFIKSYSGDECYNPCNVIKSIQNSYNILD